jgi:hypothetical protein
MSLRDPGNAILWLGVATFMGGALLWRYSARPGRPGPPWLGRLGLAMASLGIGTLAMTQAGLAWAISSICFSLIAIVHLVTILWELLRK